MKLYNVVLIDSAGAQQQRGVKASSWQNAINAAKDSAGLDKAAATDGNLLIVQFVGNVDVEGA